MTNPHELLSKAQVIREYGFPEAQLDADLRAGKIPYFTSTGERITDDNAMYFTGRHYIPRGGIEARIREMARMDGAA